MLKNDSGVCTHRYCHTCFVLLVLTLTRCWSPDLPPAIISPWEEIVAQIYPGGKSSPSLELPFKDYQILTNI